MSEQVIGLVDCNSFFCSCERLFRPETKNKPVVVLSNNDGCVVSLTPEAKLLGIKMCVPYFQIKDICREKKVHVFSTNFSLYTNISERVMGTLIKHVPEVEVYSVDEAFLDLSGMQNVSDYGGFLRDTILNHVGIPVGVGIGPNKVLAKIANRLAKTSNKANGVVNLCEKKWQDVALNRTKIEDVWGIGRANSQKMQSMGIKTAKDLRDFSNERIIEKVFTKVGLQIKHELMGINCFKFNQFTPPKKQIMCSRTFGESVYDLKGLKEAVAHYVTDAAEKLRGQDSVCREISIFARTNPFIEGPQYYFNESKKLSNPTANTLKLIQIAHHLLEQAFKEGFEYKKVGVVLSDFYTSMNYQLDLFQDHDNSKQVALMNVMDRINKKEGENIVRSGACGVLDKAWNMNRNFKSPRYTTSWSELKIFN